MPADSQIWNRIATRYSRTPIKNTAVYERKLAITQEYMRPDMCVLEFGCGTGSTAIRHAPFVREILCVDFSEKMLDIAQARVAAAAVENVHFQRASIETFTAEGQGFDMVLALSLLHLLSDWETAIAKIHALLPPGGLFISSTACLAEHYRFLRTIAPIGRRLGVLPRVCVFSVDELRTGLQQLGFEIEQCWVPDGEKAHVAFIVARRKHA